MSTMTLKEAAHKLRLHAEFQASLGGAGELLGPLDILLVADAIDAHLTSRDAKGDAVAWIDHTDSGVFLRTLGACRALEDLPHGTRLYTHPSTQQAAQSAEQPSGEHCTSCDDTGEIHRADGEWLGSCNCGAAQPKPEQADVSRDPFSALARGIKESGGDGQWRPCSGCYDTEDRHPTQRYMHSNVLGCDIGNGCRECGGMGVVWQDFSQYETTSEDVSEQAVGDGVAVTITQVRTGVKGADWTPYGMNLPVGTKLYPRPAVATDPHHDGQCEWKWDGSQLWHKDRMVKTWTVVKRIHPTPKRIAILNALMNPAVATAGDGVTEEMVLAAAKVVSDDWEDESEDVKRGLLEIQRAALTAALASRPVEAAQGGVPKGWKLVPVEPTWSMLQAGNASDGTMLGIYSDMLAATPEVPR